MAEPIIQAGRGSGHNEAAGAGRGPSATRQGDFAVAGAIAGLVVVVLLAARFIGSNMPPVWPLTEGFNSFSVAIPLIPVLAGWGFSVVVRCSDAVVRRQMLHIVNLLIFWLLVMLVKYFEKNDRLAELYWYLYYVPLLGIPTILAFMGVRIAAFGQVAAIRRVMVAAKRTSTLLLLLVLTNSLHHQVFVVDINNPLWDSDYTYAWGYWLVAAWIVSMFGVYVVTLFLSCRKSLRQVLMVVLVFVALGVAYSLMYALRIEWVFTSNLTLVFSIFVPLELEFCMDFGLIPSCAWQREAFTALPLDIKLMSREGDVVFQTAVASDLDDGLRQAIGLDNPPSPGSVRRCEAGDNAVALYGIEGGQVLVTKDISPIVEKRSSMARQIEFLSRRNDVLARCQNIPGMIERQRFERSLLMEAQESIASAMDVAHLLIRDDPGDDDGRRKALRKIRLILSYCKRRAAIALDELAGVDYSRDHLEVVLGEASQDLRALGIDCAVIVDLEGEVSSASASTIFDALYEFSTLVVRCDDPILMMCVRRVDDRLELSCRMESKSCEGLREREETRAMRDVLDGRGLKYSLEQDEDVVSLVVVCGGERK